MSNFDNQITEVPIDEIAIGTTIKNIRTSFAEDKVRELADSIHRDGLMNPLIVMESEDENQDTVLELIAGERRLRAIKYIQNNLDDEFLEDGVPCIQYVGSIHDALFVNASENIDREEVDEVDTAAWLAARVDDDGISQTELAKKLHKPLQWVNFRVLFHERACPELKDLLREGLISFTAAYELSKNIDSDEQVKRVKKARKFNEKISIEAAQSAGDPNKSSKPSKKGRDLMRARLSAGLEKGEKTLYRGADTALRWVDGLITDEEMDEFMKGLGGRASDDDDDEDDS
jgi:ParB family chromosome partitioning protein